MGSSPSGTFATSSPIAKRSRGQGRPAASCRAAGTRARRRPPPRRSARRPAGPGARAGSPRGRPAGSARRCGPSSVRIPVAKTSGRASPPVQPRPAEHQVPRLQRRTRRRRASSADRDTGTDSPVSVGHVHLDRARDQPRVGGDPVALGDHAARRRAPARGPRSLRRAVAHHRGPRRQVRRSASTARSAWRSWTNAKLALSRITADDRDRQRRRAAAPPARRPPPTAAAPAGGRAGGRAHPASAARPVRTSSLGPTPQPPGRLPRRQAAGGRAGPGTAPPAAPADPPAGEPRASRPSSPQDSLRRRTLTSRSPHPRPRSSLRGRVRSQGGRRSGASLMKAVTPHAESARAVSRSSTGPRPETSRPGPASRSRAAASTARGRRDPGP